MIVRLRYFNAFVALCGKLSLRDTCAIANQTRVMCIFGYPLISKNSPVYLHSLPFYEVAFLRAGNA